MSRRAALSLASHLFWGLLFGFGLALSGMTSPAKVLAFLDLTGAWDPSLLFVLGGAVVTATLAFRLILGRTAPLLGAAFPAKPSRTIDRSLVLGSLIFGVGWGIGGYCPGPGVALLTTPTNPETALFLGGLLLGTLLASRRTKRPPEG